MLGTLVNTATVLVGSVLGILLKSKLPKKSTEIIFQIIGLIVVFLGIKMALEVEQIIFMVLSLIFGSIIGQLLKLESHLNSFAEYLQKKFGGNGNTFAEGFIASTLLFCTGSLVILGALEEGSGKTPTLFFTKSVMDGITSVFLAASFGRGVIFSSFAILIIQGSLTLLVILFGNFLPISAISLIGTVGGIILLGLGLNILELKKIPVINMLPSILLAGILGYFFG